MLLLEPLLESAGHELLLGKLLVDWQDEVRRQLLLLRRFDRRILGGIHDERDGCLLHRTFLPPRGKQVCPVIEPGQTREEHLVATVTTCPAELIVATGHE